MNSPSAMLTGVSVCVLPTCVPPDAASNRLNWKSHVSFAGVPLCCSWP